MFLLLKLIHTMLGLYMWAIIIHVVMGWLVAGNVINTQNRFVYGVGMALYRITEPVYRLIRRVLPQIGGLDFTPAVVILAIVLIQSLIVDMVGRHPY